MNQSSSPDPTLEPLPLDLAWPGLALKLSSHRNLVLVAEPGAGKTTRFPPRLIRSSLIDPGKKVLMLEPRRLAARAAAHRIASEQRWSVGGGEIGYQVRFENRTTNTTRLQILTEGLLAGRLKNDPELSDVGCVILDEFHERSQHTDLALGLLFELQELARPDLRIIVMSATLDADRVASFLKDCPIERVPGRTYPVEVHHGKRPLMLDTGPRFLDQVAESIGEILANGDDSSTAGDLLVFLPGAREIRGVRERLSPIADRRGFRVLELHGSLPLEEQDLAIRKNTDGTRKIVLATNIAETSLTIDGVSTVIDTGLARVVHLDGAGFERLQISRISLASATQRTGRAGRQGPGVCWRLWSKLDESSMPDFEQPELLRTDLSEALLTLLSQGVSDVSGFSWFEKPPDAAIKLALQTLSDLGFRDPASGVLTSEGREAIKLPLPARLARLVIEAVKAGAPTLGARLAALLSEKDIVIRAADLKQQAACSSDILARLHLFTDWLERNRTSSSQIDTAAARNAQRVAELLESSARRLKLTRQSKINTSASEDDLARRLLLLAYPDRICRRRRAKEPAARMVGGRGVTLAPFSTVETSEFFIAIDSSEPPPHLRNQPDNKMNSGARGDVQISIASSIERAWIERLFPQSLSIQSELVFDNQSLAIQKQRALAFHDLPLEEPHLSRPEADEALGPLINACIERWSTSFVGHEELNHLLSRLEFLATTFANDDSAPAQYDFNATRRAFLEEVCFAETRLSDVLAKPLNEAFQRHLPVECARFLNEAAPAFITAPTGSRLRVHYPTARPPYLEVRVQEIFGLKESPRVAKASVPIVLHLLGPNFRPVQVTSDLASFWRTGYIEVRKELRARYPKHSWPEDPTTATPEAKGRRRG